MSCKKSSSSSSAAIIEWNDDLLIQILLFLPARSAVRAQLVSLRWRSLISTPSFYRLHTLHHRHRHRRPQTLHSFILCDADSRFFICHPTVRRLIPLSFGFPFVAILQSCNGLFLLRGSNTEHGRYSYFVFNPATAQCRNLYPLPSGNVKGYCLMFDPSLSLHYRVVYFVGRRDSIFYYVYDSESREWMLGGELVTDDGFRFGIYFKGGIYIPRVCKASSLFTPGGDLITVANPRVYSAGSHRNYAMASNGVLLNIFLGKDSKVLHVHETKEIDKGWTKHYSIDLSPIFDTFEENSHSAIDLLGMIRGEKLEDSLLLLYLPGKIVMCRFSDGLSEILVEFAERKVMQFGFKNTYQFVETLASV